MVDVSAASVALRGRAMARSLMTSTCTVFESGEPITDPTTGEVTDSHETIWFGPCRIKPGSTQASVAENMGLEVYDYDYLITIPFEVTDVIEGHRLTVTDSPDPALVGITVEIRKIDRGDTITARRLACRDVV